MSEERKKRDVNLLFPVTKNFSVDLDGNISYNLTDTLAVGTDGKARFRITDKISVDFDGEEVYYNPFDKSFDK